jgi:hypothetical protein
MATRTISTAGGNWNATATWDETAVPILGDAVVVRADGASGNVTVTVDAACTTFDLTAGAYNGTFTINSGKTLVVSGNVTLNSSGSCTGISGTGIFEIRTAATLTSNGKTFSGGFTDNYGTTLTLADDANITGIGNFGNSGWSTVQVITSSSKVMTIAGGLNQAARLTLTSTTLKLTGGTWAGNGSVTQTTSGTGTIEIAGTVTGGTYNSATCILKYTSGSLSTFYLVGGSPTFSGAWTFPLITIGGSPTLTLDTNISITTLTTVNNNLTVTMSGGYTVGVTNLNPINNALTIAMGATGAWTITTLTIPTGVTMTFTGAQNISATNVYLQGTGTLVYPSSQTLTVSGAFKASSPYTTTTTIRAGTPSTAATLALSGAAIQSTYATYTDITVTGATIFNVFGGTLTRTSGISNIATNTALYTSTSTGFIG